MPQRALAQVLDGVDVHEPAGADDPDAVGGVLHLVERVRREEDGAPVGGGLAQELANLGLKERVEPRARLVEHDQLGPVHERLHEPDLLAVALREVADRPVELQGEPLAQLVAEAVVGAAAQARERVELLAGGHPVVQPQLAGEVADPAPRLDALAPGVEPEHGRAARRRVDQVEQEPDRRALARPVRAEIAEHLAALDAQVEPDERAGLSLVGLGEPAGLDGRRGHRVTVPPPAAGRPG